MLKNETRYDIHVYLSLRMLVPRDPAPNHLHRLGRKQLIVNDHESGVSGQRHSADKDHRQEHAAEEGEQQHGRNREQCSLDQDESHESHDDRDSGEHQEGSAGQGDAHERRYQAEGQRGMPGEQQREPV